MTSIEEWVAHINRGEITIDEGSPLARWNALMDEIVFSWEPHLSGNFLLDGKQKARLIKGLRDIPSDELEEYMEHSQTRMDKIAPDLDGTVSTLDRIRELHSLLQSLTSEQIDTLCEQGGHLEHDPGARFTGQKMKFVPDANWEKIYEVVEAIHAAALENVK